MSGQSAILTYHSLDRTGSVISVDPDLFRCHIEGLLESNVPVVSLEQALARPGCVTITFDDGFENFLEYAMPVLDQYRLPATVFVVSDYCGRQNTWPTQPRSGIPKLRLMSWSQLRQLPDSIALGGHTATHADLAKLPMAPVVDELSRSRAALEDSTGRQVNCFAYPYGASSPAVRELVRRYYMLACGTALKFLGPGPDPMNLPRIDAYYMRRVLSVERLMAPFGTAYIGFRSFLRTLRAHVVATS